METILRIQKELDKIEKNINKYRKDPQEEKYDKIRREIIKTDNRLYEFRCVFVELLKIWERIIKLRDRLEVIREGGGK